MPHHHRPIVRPGAVQHGFDFSTTVIATGTIALALAVGRARLAGTDPLRTSGVLLAVGTGAFLFDATGYVRRFAFELDRDYSCCAR